MRLMSVNGDMVQGRYGAGRKSPLGLGGTVAVHALVVGAFLLIPKEVIDIVRQPPPLVTKNIPLPPEPQPTPPQPLDSKTSAQPRPERPTAPRPEVSMPSDPPLTGTGDPIGSGPLTPPYIPPPPPIPEPVLTEPQIDPRALPAFQPDYPGAMIRQQVEGKVTVRVSISAEGRVTAIEKVSATDESFWLATERHALRKWRFRAATRDGVPVPSTKVLTVRFTLTDR